ncbi:MAG: DNA-protecting protein DprA [Deltaproteobacteria bacterium]|nr:DNA-protecting protein DprA [Deltaproteobacteria bacterium]
MKSKSITIAESAYPYLLRQIYDPPKSFNLLGELPDFGKNPPVAVVGSRKPTEYGRENAEKLASVLASAGFTIISGLAYGIDSIAHKACLENKGLTVAVLGSGFDNIYPKTHKKLAEKIIETGGAVITEFDDDMAPLARNFPVRNRIISGLSLGVVVVEAAVDSGTLITAKLAMEHGRDVFAVPGLVGNVNSAGTHSLIRDGATLIESAQDVIDALSNKLSTEWKTKFSGQSFGIGDKERAFIRFFGSEAVTKDELIEKSGLKPQEVLSMISVLECSELIRDADGKGYIRIKTR